MDESDFIFSSEWSAQIKFQCTLNCALLSECLGFQNTERTERCKIKLLAFLRK